MGFVSQSNDAEPPFCIIIVHDKMERVGECLQNISPLCSRHSFTSVKIIKNEVGCRDDTVPKNC